MKNNELPPMNPKEFWNLYIAYCKDKMIGLSGRGLANFMINKQWRKYVKK